MQMHSRLTAPRGLNHPALTLIRFGKSCLKTAMLGLCLLPLAGGVAQAQTVLLNENFNSYTNDAVPTGWYSIGTTTNPPKVQDGQLRWSFIRPADVASFQSVTLENAGDYIQASFDVRYTTAPTAVTTGPSLALYNSGGVPVAASTAGTSVAGHVGYKAYKAFDVTGSVPNDFVLFRDNALSRDRYSNTVLKQQASGSTIALNTVYSVSLNIERQANSDLLITYSFGNLTQSHTVAAASAIYTFDEIGINLFAGDFPGVGFLDNVLVTTSSIPEPSAYALLFGGASILLTACARRRVRSLPSVK